MRTVRWAVVALAGTASVVVPAAVGASPTEGLPPPHTTEAAKVELGRRLFFDPVASRSGERSCASCHDPEHGFSDTQRASEDDVLLTVRHSQTLIDSHRNPTAHWDGQFGSIEELVFARLDLVDGVKGRFGLGQATGGGGYGPPAPPPSSAPRQRQPDPADADPAPPEGEAPPTTPGDGEEGSSDPKAKDKDGTGGKDGTPEGPPPDAPSAERGTSPRQRRGRAISGPRVLPLDLTRLPNVAKTIEEHGRYAEGFTAAFGSAQVTVARVAEAIGAYCRSLHSREAPIDRYLAGQKDALSPAARRGLALFRGQAGCVQCHTMEGAHPVFTDYRFHNTGVEFGARKINPRLARSSEVANDLRESDVGRETFSRSSVDRRAFKTATLRDLQRRGPYMHTGGFDTLESVVRHYARGGSKDPEQDARLRPLALEDRDVADLVAFLESLDGDERPGLAADLGPARSERTRVRLVDARRRPLAGWAVDLVPEGDRLPGPQERVDGPRHVTTDADGVFSFSPGLTTHMRLGLPDHLVPLGGALVPDTARDVVLTVPVDGRVTLAVTYPADAAAPASLVAEHEGTMRLPGHAVPRTLLAAGPTLGLDGRKVVSYEGWRRTDVPAEVIVRIPGDRTAWQEHRLTLSDARTLKLDLDK